MKKILSFVVVMAAAAMVSCAGNPNKKAAEAQAEQTVVEAAAGEKCEGECTEECEKCDSAACEKCEKECCKK